MLSKRFDSTEVDRRTSTSALRDLWFTSSDTHQVIEGEKGRYLNHFYDKSPYTINVN